jgi:uncharacterized NAD(P)/FAD-binding protein YdhS
MRLTRALASGRVALLAAKVTSIEPNAAGALVRYRRRGQRESTSLQVGMIVDCTGIVKDPRATGNPVIQRLFERGLARTDALNIGIDVAEDCAVINRNGIASRRLFAVGPLTRAAFWEIVAILTSATSAPNWPSVSRLSAIRSFPCRICRRQVERRRHR